MCSNPRLILLNCYSHLIYRVATTVVDRVVGFDLDKHNGFVSFVFILTRTMPSFVFLLTSTMASFKYCSNIV